ncbi:MAG: 4-hydroxy-3-methylbut-2-enyl diphosphate reductase [Elusimicrobia bacterium]|nr:4-hydroxy-3-methylbut-2-enyl diphosphate reductase [Elusimicrobiota bacterium]
MEKDSKVRLAKSAGFCPGVQKAIARVRELSRAGKGPVYTLGPLVHNSAVIARLAAEGIHDVESLAEVKGQDGVLVIRAHGVPPELEAEARWQGLEVVDATCPLVKKAQYAVSRHARQGFATVIVGDRGHAEVKGLLGYAGRDAFVVAGPKEAAKLPRLDKVNVVAQTTQEEEVFLKTVAVVKRRAKAMVVSDTICKPSRDRQRETAELAGMVDLMIVVGDKHSANTARLAALCRRHCPRTVAVQSSSELDAAVVRAARRIGVTAGASTPDWLVERVLRKVAGSRAVR